MRINNLHVYCKKNVEKNITLISLIISLFGFVKEIVFYIFSFKGILTKVWFYNIVKYTDVVSFQLFSGNLFSYKSNFHSELESNFFELIFYTLFLVGVYLYRKNKEKRILQFSFSVLLFSSIVNIISLLIYFIISYKSISFMKGYVFFFFWLFIVGVLSYYILMVLVTSFLKKANESFSSINNVEVNFNIVSLKKRLFHFLIDAILITLILSKFLFIYPPALKFMSNIIGLSLTIFIVSTPFYLLYYLFFECFFKATPAKFLTQSIVVTEDRSKLNIGRILTRTLSRRIPFNEFSFFSKGWHDKLSETMVVSETNKKGIEDNKYLWFFPILLVAGITLHFFIDWQKDYEYYGKSSQEYDKKIEVLDKKIEEGFLKSGNCLSLSIPNSSGFSRSYTHFFIERIEGDKIFTRKIDKTFFIVNKLYEHYLENKNSLKVIELSRRELLESICRSFSDYKKGKINGVNLVNNGEALNLEYIYDFNEPILNLTPYGGHSISSFNLDIENEGLDVYLIAIENMEGNVKFDSYSLPRLYGKKSSISERISLYGNRDYNKRREPFSFDLIFKMSLNSVKSFRYKVNVDFSMDKQEMRRVY
ncbi:RDD family protein [Tenacibaculum sp.]|nr:RDD family protein [Tenacibaculum sp.]